QYGKHNWQQETLRKAFLPLRAGFCNYSTVLRQDFSHPTELCDRREIVMKSPPTASESQAHSLKCELATEVLSSFGRLRLEVTGWSMLPTIHPGDTLLIDKTAGEQVAEGDIVLFSRDRRLFAHRTIKKEDGLAIITQGDGMARPDPPVPGSDVLGKVSYIVRDGKLIQPTERMSVPARALAQLIRRSETAARITVRIHDMRKKGVRKHGMRGNPTK